MSYWKIPTKARIREALDSGSVFDPGSDGGLDHPRENGFRYATVAARANHSHQLPFVLIIYIFINCKMHSRNYMIIILVYGGSPTPHPFPSDLILYVNLVAKGIIWWPCKRGGTVKRKRRCLFFWGGGGYGWMVSSVINLLNYEQFWSV